jgi:hypothetical protein
MRLTRVPELDGFKGRLMHQNYWHTAMGPPKEMKKRPSFGPQLDPEMNGAGIEQSGPSHLSILALITFRNYHVQTLS